MERTSDTDPGSGLIDSVASLGACHPGQCVLDAGRILDVGTVLDLEQDLEGDSPLTGQRPGNGRDFWVGSPAMDLLDDHCMAVYLFGH